MTKSFAVVKEKPLNRSAAYSPLSAGWSLYDPKDIAAELGLPVEVVHAALEKTGFNKAVRIREELIRWKERLRKEQAEITKEKSTIYRRLSMLTSRENEVRQQLENVRNVLRIPREAPDTSSREPKA